MARKIVDKRPVRRTATPETHAFEIFFKKSTGPRKSFKPQPLPNQQPLPSHRIHFHRTTAAHSNTITRHPLPAVPCLPGLWQCPTPPGWWTGSGHLQMWRGHPGGAVDGWWWVGGVFGVGRGGIRMVATHSADNSGTAETGWFTSAEEAYSGGAGLLVIIPGGSCWPLAGRSKNPEPPRISSTLPAATQQPLFSISHLQHDAVSDSCSDQSKVEQLVAHIRQGTRSSTLLC